MRTTRRYFLLSTVAAVITPARLLARPASLARTFRPEAFGARGDGITDDSDAMAALGDAVTANGGGTIVFRRRVYRVGRQQPNSDKDAGYAFVPAKLIELKGCTGAVAIKGNGATLRCTAGLRYGIFDAAGARVDHPMPYIGPGLATPYWAMISIENCSGPIEVTGIELDGNNDALLLGGEYGDVGRQIPAHGLLLRNNSGPEIISNVHTHHHAMDGLYIDGVDADAAGAAQRLIRGVRSEYNGRQGCSIVGGNGYSFEGCAFNHTGKAALFSPPGAGVDIEAEGGKRNRNFRFVDCTFADNGGCGLVADTGPSENARFLGCTFVGTTNWSAWPCKPRFRFSNCSFVGALVRAYGDADPERAAQFVDCSFRDDPALSPTGQVYGGTNPNNPLADLSDAQNMLFSRCSFVATHQGQLPWSTGAIYADCLMEQHSTNQAYPRGRFIGKTIINGNVDLYGSRVDGEVVINGKRFAAMHF